jgi:hypothetical protein
MINKCGVCPQSSSNGVGWWTAYNYKTEPPTVYDLCPNCYRNKSLIAYRDTISEALEAIRITDQEPALHVAMQVMKQHCIGKVRDLPFND